MLCKKHIVFLVALMLGGMGLTYSVFFLEESVVVEVTREDGLVEMLGALLFLGGGLVFLAAFFLSGRSKGSAVSQKKRLRMNLFYIVLSLVLLFAFLEEISWGQRFFGIETPTILAEQNRQNEFNIHNLKWFHGHDATGQRKGFWALLLNMDRLFSVFWFVFGVVIPIVTRWIPSVRRAFDRIRLPTPHVLFAFLFFGNYLGSKLLESLPGLFDHGVVEVKETNVAMLLACVALEQFYRTWIKRRRVSLSPFSADTAARGAIPLR